jgi:hypothetical protein
VIVAQIHTKESGYKTPDVQGSGFSNSYYENIQKTKTNSLFIEDYFIKSNETVKELGLFDDEDEELDFSSI